MKIKVKYFKLTVDGAQTFDFNGSGHCEQVLRGLVHSGHEVTINEVSEIREVSPEQLDNLRETDANFRFIDDSNKISGLSAECGTQACVPNTACR